jgi:plasmid stabilization system protein ParE
VIRPLLLSPAAERDVAGAFDAFERIQAGLGRRFTARLREVLQRIEALPELFPRIWHDVRAVRLKTFRYVVYYVVLADRVEVLAVLHGARDASAWQSRA